MELKNVRTRFAPSPTGMLHFGNANTALFNWMLARAYNGAVILRVEDTDLERSTGNFEQKICDDLKWLGIDWDEGPDVGGDFGPYRQMEREDIYNEYFNKLLDSGNAYRCYCTKEELDAEREDARREKRNIVYSGKCRNLTPDDWARIDTEGKPYTIRFRNNPGEKVIVKDLIRGDISFNSDELDDFIIIRSNGVPVFLLTNAVDDALMKISHVVRGEDHISNTPKQVLILEALGLPTPVYLHTPIILGPDRTKLSKRHGAVSVFQFREQGYLPEALVNYLAFLGWNPKDEREFFSIADLTKIFSVENMSKSPSVFNYERLKYLNSHWMQEIDNERLKELCYNYMIDKGWVTKENIQSRREWFELLLENITGRLKTLEDIEAYADFFFKDFESYEEKGAKKHFKGDETVKTLSLLRDGLAGLEKFDMKSIEDMMRVLVEKHDIPGKKIIHPTRLALSGKTVGPGLFELMELLGREKCLSRLDTAIEWIKSNS